MSEEGSRLARGVKVGLGGVAALVAAGYVYANTPAFHKGKTGFGSCTTAQQVVRDAHGSTGLKGKVIIVTGANSGIGFETAKAFALSSATVIIPCRTLEKAKSTIMSITQTVAAKSDARCQPTLVPMILDLSDLKSVKSLVAEVKKKYKIVHAIVCNAGVMAIPKREVTAQGLEMQVGVCHVAHFALVTGLLDELKAAKGARVVCVSSLGHRCAKSKAWASNPTFDGDEPYDPWVAYGHAKMSNILFARELNERHASDGITAYSLHPGGIHTNLQTHVGLQTRIFWAMVTPFFFKNTEQGAATSAFCATHPKALLDAGSYFSDCNATSPVYDWADDENLRRTLWETTAKVVGK